MHITPGGTQPILRTQLFDSARQYIDVMLTLDTESKSTASSAAPQRSAKNGSKRTTLTSWPRFTTLVGAPPPLLPPTYSVLISILRLMVMGGTGLTVVLFLSTFPEAVEAAMSHLTVDALARAEKAEQAAEKKAIKETAKAERELAKKLSSKIVLKRVERAKRKHVIVVTGLEAFGLDLKKVAKDFGKKFACGSSVTKGAAAGQDEIVVQGDLSDDILEYIEEKYPEVPVDNIEQVEEKKKKKSEGP